MLLVRLLLLRLRVCVWACVHAVPPLDIHHTVCCVKILAPTT